MGNKKKSKNKNIQPGYFLDFIFNGIKNVFFGNSSDNDELKKCNYCGVKKATWFNSLCIDYSCDECVPRCCSCQIYPINGDENDTDINNWEYKKDSKGNYLPCEDWEKIKRKK